MLCFYKHRDEIILDWREAVIMHIQRIILLVISVLLIVVGLFVTLIMNYPNPGQNLTEPILAVFGLIAGILAIVGDKKKSIGLWPKIIITVVGLIVALVGLVLPDLAKESVSKVSSNASSSTSDALTDLVTAAGNAARTLTNTQPQASNSIILVIFIGLAFVVTAWIFNFIKKADVTS